MSLQSRWLFGAAALFCLALPSMAGQIFVGSLSYDTFIPAGNGGPGVNAIDIANLTGAFSLPPDFPVASSLTFMDAALLLTLTDTSTELFQLGDLGPGFLLDQNGNPVIQVASDQEFSSAELTATLSPQTFSLDDGTSFMVASTSLDVVLLPSSGNALSADIDQTTISVTAAPESATPEPAADLSMLVGLACLWAVGEYSRRARVKGLL